MEIEEILSKIPDKPDYYKTTSHQFKKDFWEFFSSADKLDCVELGTHSGRSTMLLSEMFRKVYTFEIDTNKIKEAKLFNKESVLNNVEYFQAHIYRDDWTINVPEADVFFIDAVHHIKEVTSDVGNCLRIHSQNRKVFVFDDYGLSVDVRSAIHQLVNNNLLEIVKYIGHEPGWSYGPGKVLTGYEGIICKEVPL